ncbi:hypothetical protein IY145_04165 [Methylosinus sp. H3A]|uniref:glycosyl hydrolase family 28-related protein n=1 Tax=Methylosinus sp. H3A TaxID=2785786 RepID=UPI0018C28BF1|nr:glycosyl hydrolase family 28-related protein [Methylosinus sp. H3A]MBG0808564.1 hypothetical protein [Methylosinus sp. H3A]
MLCKRTLFFGALAFLASTALADESCVNSACAVDNPYNFTSGLSTPTPHLSDNTNPVATGAMAGAVPIATFGATCDDAALITASTSERTIVIPSGTTCTVSNDLTLTTKTPWIVEQDALFLIDSGKAMCLHNAIIAGFYQIFYGNGAVSCLDNPNPTWWGAKGDGVADDTAAINAFVVASAGKDVFVPPGTYNTTGSGSVIVNNGTTIRCSGTHATIFRSTTASPNGGQLFNLLGWDSRMLSCGFSASVTQTGGHYVALRGRNAILNDWYAENDFNAVLMTGVLAQTLNGVLGNGSAGAIRATQASLLRTSPV